MSTPARIDELRKKFDENPRRYFAPLANEYRKAGDLAQAIALCREHLPKQPGHMSGHIVFGQALYEADDLAEARAVFESALALDPENLIALRHLGDIAKAGGDAAGARRWYERVLDADPRNDDIAAQLTTLGTGNTPVSSAAVPAITNSFAAARSSAEDASDYESNVGPLPTPDASMRAVDFDVVNAKVAGSTPLYAEAIDYPADDAQRAHSGESDPAGADAEAGGASIDSRQQVAPRAFEPLDLDAMDTADPSWGAVDESHHEQIDVTGDAGGFAGDEAPEQGAVAGLSSNEVADEPQHADVVPGSLRADGVTAAVSAHAPAPAPEPGDDAESTEESTALDADDVLSVARPSASYNVDDSDFFGTEFADDEFEDGILAPEWPQASELIAKIGTPRSSTPVSVRITPEAAAAFGLEPREDHAGDSTDLEADDARGETGGAAASANTELAAHADEGGPDAPTQVVAWDEAPPDEHAAEMSSERSLSEREPLPASVQEFDESVLDDSDQSDASEIDTTPMEPVELPWMVDQRAAETEENTPAAAQESDAYFAESARDEPHSETLEATETVAHGIEEDEPAEASFADVMDDEAAAAETNRPEPSAAFVTETMGELLVSQGFIERAVGVYEELVRRRPYDPVLTSRLTELRERLAPQSEPDAPTRNSPAIAEGTDRATTPRSVSAEVPAFHSPEPLHPDELPVTARELFARLATRRVPRRTPSVSAPAVQDASGELSNLFGGAAVGHDDVAARALADAFAPISAAEMSNGASMSFDHGGPSAPTPLSSPALQAPPVVSPPSPGGSTTASTSGSSSFSFDRFFPDPAARGAENSPPNAESTPSPAAPPAADDLAEFSAWLKGLGNK